MFSNALKSFSSNITSAYTISPQPVSAAGPWKIFEAKRKNSGKAASVFVFEKKSLDAGSSGLSSGKSNLKRAHEEVLERLKREASSLARLRHPSILELAEPVEETRNGLMFATEPVTASLASLLAERDEGRGSKYMVEEQDGTRRRRELEMDELEIQKGLLQLGKGLEFLHESAGLVHANLTPDAILINAKGDWKIAGLGFCGPFENSTAPTSLVAISLHEVLNYDPRLPKTVQLNLDYSSPDFVLDNNLVAAADMFSLGLLILSLYNSPHRSPLSVNGSLSTYKRAIPSGIPSRSNNFLVPSLPAKMPDLITGLITRRPAQRLTARAFQEASYFDNILVSTLRFLESLPAKTPSEKAAFMRGLKGIMNQFPTSVLEKKILPALLEEMKDKELLAPILTDVFAMIRAMPTGKRAFTEKVVPRLREVFMTRDPAKDAGLMIVLESMPIAAENCAGKEFREDILPIIILALESATPSLVDAGLSTLSSILPVLDFSTIKNELFPVIAHCFAKTNSLAIKIKGLEAFSILCGADAILDKYTVQEKIVPLLKAIKTKEPGVMMAALKVFKQVGQIADSDFLAMEILPVLWSFSLGPLLNLQQFQAYMSLIKDVGNKIETEHTKKLQEMSTGNEVVVSRTTSTQRTAAQETDFETLVSGRKAATNDDLMNEWGPPSNVSNPTFSWQTQAATASARTITPDQSINFSAMTPSKVPSNPWSTTPQTGISQSMQTLPLQPSMQTMPLQPSMQTSQLQPAMQAMTLQPSVPSNPNPSTSGGIDWSAAANTAKSRPVLQNGNSFGATSRPANFSLPPPPTTNGTNAQRFAPPPSAPAQKSGLDKYESLI